MATHSGQPEDAKQPALTAYDRITPDLGPSIRAIVRWIAVVNSDEPRSHVVAQMERVLDDASLVRSSMLQAIFAQTLTSLQAESGDVAQPMLDAAENLDRLLETYSAGLALAAVRRAAVLLLRAGDHEPAARLLGFLDAQEPGPLAYHVAEQLEELTPVMQDALGADLDDRCQAGAALSPEEAVRLAAGSLRLAAGAVRQ